ncbi:MAG: protein kinase, partial [Polyangia bacterium]|nr:protein kinase [Polyangia bacterium]
MADHDKNAQKAPKKTVLAASGAYHEQASDNAPPGSREEPVAGLLGVADTFVAPRGVDASGRPITAPPASSHATVLGASGAAAAKQGGARLAITAPEIGSLAGGMTACVPDLPDRDPSALVGSVVADRYRILKLLGQGGMGVVYLAEHVVIEKRVALKVLNEELTHSRDAVSRFIYEAKAASKIGHENIIDINDFGTTPEGGVFFVMEFLDGSDLADLLKDQGRIGWEE